MQMSDQPSIAGPRTSVSELAAWRIQANPSKKLPCRQSLRLVLLGEEQKLQLTSTLLYFRRSQTSMMWVKWHFATRKPPHSTQHTYVRNWFNSFNATREGLVEKHPSRSGWEASANMAIILKSCEIKTVYVQAFFCTLTTRGKILQKLRIEPVCTYRQSCRASSLC